ncbi:WD repeat-containing protein 7-like, partial [Amphibalanus amphitrite]|uniref:WD repeat-containing protein 7-like n=1 Tax=Amphibalanus amphitrite TaxID=1232801 RepID=UPI001C90873B
ELFCPPVSIHTELVGEPGQQVLVRGDCLGQVALWRLPQLTNTHIQQLMEQHGEYQSPAELPPTVLWSIERAWRTMKPQPVGILDQLESAEGGAPRLTSSIYLPLQEGRLVCGREDGTIIIVSATHTVMLHLLHGKHQSYDNWPVHQILSGHRGPVTALLFPHLSHSRYQISHLVSGGEDFSVCLWDLINGALLHRFVVQAGIVLQLHVPPESVSPRMQQCICSVAADYSVALLSLKERKCLMLASRHLFPVTTVKWRPLDDFLVVATEDGSVSVWQMETGHLDRVVHGTTAQEVLSACDEHMTVSTSEGGMANPAVHFFRGLRHRNLSAIRHAAKRGLQQLQNSLGNQGQNGPDKPRAYSLMVQGLRTSPSDPDAHVLFFDIESLIVDLLTEAYSQMTTEQLEEHGLIQLSEYQRVLQLTQSESPDAQQKITEFFGRVKNKAGDMEKRLKDKDTRGYLSRMKELKEQSEAIRDQLKERAEGSEDLRKLKSRAQVARTKLEEKIKHEMEDNPDAAGILARVKEGAETMGGIIHAKAGGVTPKGAGEEHKDSDGELEGRSRIHLGQTDNQTMEICQLLLSLIHAWGVDAEIDRLCESKLGMLRPKHPVCYGLISKHGFVSLLLPTFLGGPASAAMSAPLAERTVTFTRRTHWELSCALTSNHLLAVIALADTLMSMNNTSFMSETERRKRLQKQLTRSLSQSNQTPNKSQEGLVELQANFWAQVREGWSKMATLHCVQFPERLDASGVVLKKPLVEMLARRWQDRCIEIRQAAQALLLAELRRLSPRSLKALVDWWAPMLPSYGEASSAAPAPASAAPLNDDHDHTDGEPDDYGAEDQMEEEAARRAAANAAEVRRKQATAIILLGVIGAEFGQAVSGGGGRAHGVEGFGLGPLALRTSQALAHLLLAPPTAKLPAHTPLRRAAIDLIGRGFAQWEPHIDASRVLLAMLELCCEADGMAPSMTYGLPLAAAADTARTARHAVALIATARPQVFVTTMAREVARYNSLQQNAQSINVVVHHSVLMRAKPEILRVISLLIEKSHNELVKFLIELTDILLHCLDPGHLRQRPLQEVFPVVGRFHQITHCTSSRRVAVGTANGTLAIYDLRQTNKTQQLHAHTKAITACSFSPDGKFLASYSTGENKISFWQTSAGMFGLGHSQTRCVKTYSTPPLPEIVRMNPPRQSRLVWVANKTVTLLLSDGTEQRYNV